MSKALQNIQAIGIALLFTASLPTLVRLGTGILMPHPEHPRMERVARISKDASKAQREKYDKDYEDREKAYDKAYEEYNELNKTWNTKYFYLAVISALILAVVGIFLPITSLSIGFIFGAAFTAISGFAYGWFYLSALPKFIALLIALILLIVFVVIQHKRANK